MWRALLQKGWNPMIQSTSKHGTGQRIKFLSSPFRQPSIAHSRQNSTFVNQRISAMQDSNSEKRLIEEDSANAQQSLQVATSETDAKFMQLIRDGNYKTALEKLDASKCVALIQVFSHCGEHQRVENLIKSMNKDKIQASRDNRRNANIYQKSIVFFNNLVDYAQINDRFADIPDILREMRKLEVRITYNFMTTLIESLSRHGHYAAAVSIMDVVMTIWDGLPHKAFCTYISHLPEWYFTKEVYKTIMQKYQRSQKYFYDPKAWIIGKEKESLRAILAVTVDSANHAQKDKEPPNRRIANQIVGIVELWPKPLVLSRRVY
ncbi:hypothetical protein PROFUN_14842 [Planoprotostelium fungivorum]|uniref:Uncharacterized protein n=1 Tax=Planoprotostelium fungivorum TaxID=1890364 RepID=A0A2P6MYL4_9EUKA|nr:hypothetical protein PROFUN_14842 [Planoprotostelium fungivorum]